MRSALAALPLLLLSCAHRKGVETDELPVKRVVVYRNGVGYFERAGRVDAERVTFKVRKGHVGDFLASLAVMERGGSSVRSASFPLEVEEAPVEEGPNAGKVPPLATVVLGLDGKRHDLAVGYIAEQPIWRPSYRLVLGQEGPTLQGWGIVENLSGEDWTDVSMSLVAGAPISFRADLATPVTPPRPMLTDRGEVIAAVPRSESVLASRPAPAVQPPSAPAPAAPYGGAVGGAPGAAQESYAGKKSSAPKSKARRSEVDMYLGEDYPSASSEARRAEPEYSSAPRDLTMLASQQVTVGSTRYELPGTVTVPDKSATMVLFMSEKVPGEAAHFFSPNGGVPDSYKHPFRMARFTNATQGLLEKGPIAVFEAGSFLGQGMLEPLASGAEATVPFALDRGVAVDLEQKSEQRGARLARIEAGRLSLERDQVQRTSYRLKNGHSEPVKVVLRHSRASGMKLYEPPLGTQDKVGEGVALIPVEVAAGSDKTQVVEERRAFLTQADWFSPEADDAVKSFLGDARADAKLVAKLKQAWELRRLIVKAVTDQNSLTGQQRILETAAQQTRANLETLAIKKVEAKDLRAQLADKLAELDKELGNISKRLVELEISLNEQRVRFNELVQSLSLERPLGAT